MRRNDGNSRCTQRKTTGFTLLELLVAIAIFSVLSVTAYSGLKNFLTAQKTLQAVDAEFASLHRAIMLIEADLSNAITRGVRDEFGDDVAAMRLAADGVLEFTRKRPDIPLEFSLADMARVEYALDGGVVSRKVWEQLDRVPDSKFEQRDLMSGVQGISWEFYQNGWQDYWPLRQDPLSRTRLPAAVRLTLALDNGRSLQRVILIGNQS